MIGYVLECMYVIYKVAHSTYNPVVKRVLSSTSSTDEEYLHKVIKASLKDDAESKAIIEKLEQNKQEEEKNDSTPNFSLGDMLKELEEDEDEEIRARSEIQIK